MDSELKLLAIQVKNKSRDDFDRKKVSQMLLQDMPLIVQEEFEHRFIKKPFNKGKDAVDFYFIKLHQTNKLMGIGKDKPTHSPRPKPIVNEERYKQPKTKNTTTIGDILKNKGKDNI